MIKAIQYILFILLLTSCVNNKPVLERKQFVDILAEFFIAEALASKQDTSISVQKDYFKSYQEEILKKYHTDTAAFNSSYTFYKKDLDDMQKIYDEVINKVSALQVMRFK